VKKKGRGGVRKGNKKSLEYMNGFIINSTKHRQNASYSISDEPKLAKI
jgi:hypothetical protein